MASDDIPQRPADDDVVEARATAAQADLQQRLDPEPPSFAPVQARAQRRLMAGSAAAILVAVAIVAGVLVTRHDPVGPSGRSTTTSGPVRPLKVQLVRSDRPRSSGDAGEIPAAVEADTAFAVDLYRQLAKSKEPNLFFSPHSISVALAMTLAGADGNTKKQLEQAMHLAIPEPAFHGAINALDQRLGAPRTSDVPGADPLTVETANSLWGQAGFPFRQAFLDRLAQSYDAGMKVVDFKRAAEASRAAINAWVAAHTDNKITELIPEGAVDDLTRLVLVNAITFKASWAEKFDTAQPRPFTRADGSKITAPLMAGGHGALARGDGWRSASIPYAGGAHLVVIVPDDLSSFDLTSETLDRAGTAAGEGDVTLPKFSVTSALALAPPLKALGITDLFEPPGPARAGPVGEADLSRMDGRKDLYVSAVVHQATIDVDEKGTEAAAATAVLVRAQSGPSGSLVVDRPFLFAIRDDATGAVLFVGRVTDPSATSG